MDHIENVHTIYNGKECAFFHCQKYIHLCFMLHFNVRIEVSFLVLLRIVDHVDFHVWKMLQYYIQENRLTYYEEGIEFNLIFSRTEDHEKFQNYIKTKNAKHPMLHYNIFFATPCQGDPIVDIRLHDCGNTLTAVGLNYLREYDGKLNCCYETLFTPVFFHKEKEDRFKIMALQVEKDKKITKVQFYWKLKELFDLFKLNVQY